MGSIIVTLGTSRAGLATRSLLRRTAVGRRLLSRVSNGMNRDYEEHFHRAIKTSLRPGDVVWDIGANVGLYTRIFLDGVGPAGRVVAVEPAPQSARACRELADDGRLTVVEAAVGDTVGSVRMDIGADATAVTNRVGADGSHTVQMVTGDSLLQRFGTPPTLVKIDVEGFEIHVLRGMSRVLASPSLRQLFIEVHFGLLEANGLKDGRRQIAALLTPLGFRLGWVDPSHVVASKIRPTPAG